MKKYKVWLSMLIVSILVIGGCTKTVDIDEEKVEIRDLTTKMNIEVRPGGIGGSYWTISQVKKIEVIASNFLAKLYNDFGLPGDLMYNIWYGQGDLTTLKEAMKEGTELGLSWYSKLPKVIKKIISIKENAEDIKDATDGMIDALDYYSSNEDISNRTIKVLSYAFIKPHYDTSIPFGIWKEYINQASGIPVAVQKENNNLNFLGIDSKNKRTIFVRDAFSFKYYNGQSIVTFKDIDLYPDLESDEYDKTGEKVANRLRQLTWDVYSILDDKEPKYYPEYSKALVDSFERGEKANKEKLVDEILKASTTTEPTNQSADDSKKTPENTKSDPLLKLTWGMKLNNVKNIYPKATEKSDGVLRYLIIKENRFVSNSCIKADTTYFVFHNYQLERIDYALDMNQECNIEDLSRQELVKNKFKELYNQLIPIYDPANGNKNENLGTYQKWYNENSIFEFGFYVSLDQSPAIPYGKFQIDKNKENESVVMVSKTKEQEPSQGTQKNNEAETKTEEPKKNENVTTAFNKREFLKKLNDIEKGLSDLQPLYDSGTTVDLLKAVSETNKRWDDALNEIYGVLKKQLPSNEMSKLKQEQINWIKYRDESAEKGAKKFKGGSMEEVTNTDIKAQITKERTYELVNKYMK
jgi:uncharacterized protein YecT (DUF1311 family)